MRFLTLFLSLLLMLPALSQARPKPEAPGPIAALFAPPKHPAAFKGIIVEVQRAAGGHVGAGVPVTLKAPNGVREGVTDAEGQVHFKIAPRGRSTLTAVYQGISFPFSLGAVPSGERVEITVQENNTDLSALVLDNRHTQLTLDEDGLIVRQEWRLTNVGSVTFNPTTLPEGGLVIPGPPQTKHFGLNGEQPGVKAVGHTIYVTRPLLPRRPLTLRAWAVIPFGGETLEWRQALPVALSGATIVTPQNEAAHKRFPLSIKTRGALGEFDERDDHWQILTIKTPLKAGEPLTFAVSGLPNKTPWGALVALILVGLGFLALLFGFKGPKVPAAGHDALERERDRLLDALLRMERAFKAGRIKEIRFTKERDAVITRLIALYEALD